MFEALPHGWSTVTVQEKFDFTKKPRGLRFEVYPEIPFIPMEFVPQGPLYFSRFNLREPDEISSGTYFEPNDLLLSKITPSFENGKQGIIQELPTPFGIATTEVIPIKGRDGESEIRFLAFYLVKDDVRRSMAAKMEGSTGRQRLPLSIVKNLKVPFPSLIEQRSIAAVLAKIQESIVAQQEIIDRTRELKKALMARLFTEGLRGEPTKETEIGAVPATWEIKPLSDCAYVQTGIAKGRAVPPDEALTVPYLRVANVQDGYLDLKKMKEITIRKAEKERYLLQKDDIVLTEGGDFDKLGRGFIWKSDIEDCIHQNHIFAVRVQRERLLPEFFAYQSQSHYGKTYFLSVAHKTTNLACINTTKLKAFPVLLPSLKEQEEVVEILSVLDRKIADAVLRAESLQDLFKAMLHELMTGSIRTTRLMED